MLILSTLSPNTPSMERLALIRSLSSSAASLRRFGSRIRPVSRQISSASFSPAAAVSRLRWSPVTAPYIHRRRSFSFAPLAVSTSPREVSKDGSHDIAEKLGFEKISKQTIDECKSTAVLYKHKKTGAEIMSVSNDDENKVFGIVFRTPPKDSTGIPHILEHSVLCGSRKYPLKEPFVELLKGSLHTFLNAYTYPDRMCYPVASTNMKVLFSMK